jgi:hypothetical protein
MVEVYLRTYVDLNMAVTRPTFRKLKLIRQQFVRNSYIEFQEKLIENIVADILSRTNGRADGRTDVSST